MKDFDLSKITGKFADHRTFRPSDDLVLPDHYMGVEVEIESSKQAAFRGNPLIKIHNDDSLRNEGFELVFADPLLGQDIINALTHIEEGFEKVGGTFTERCSVHVHMDVRDLSVSQLLSMVTYYLIFERSIIKYHQRKYDRENNIFCLPFYVSQGSLQHLSEMSCILHNDMSKSNIFRRVQGGLGSLEKYHAFNVQSLFTFGSVEFRHMEGTANKGEILEWINIIQSLKKAALSSNNTPHEVLSHFRLAGVDAFIDSVLSPTLRDKLFNYDGYQEGAYLGMCLAQDVVNQYKYDQTRGELEAYIGQINSNWSESDQWLNYIKKNKDRLRGTPRAAKRGHLVGGGE